MAKKRICIDTNCIRYEENKLGDLLIVPFEDVPEDIQKLFSFFLHKSPGVESVHACQIPAVLHSAIMNSMLEGRHFEYKKFCSSSVPIEKELLKAYLNGDNICLKCKRFVCKKKQTNGKAPVETDLNCFLRHIRNAIAHGRVYYRNRNNRHHFVFEDQNDSGNLSARIVCIKSDLIQWKKILSNPRNYS